MSLRVISNHSQKEIDELIAKSEAEIARVYAKQTFEAYKSDFHLFKNWCESEDLQFLPALPSVIIEYLRSVSSEQKTIGVKEENGRRGERLAPLYSLKTLKRHVAAISAYNAVAGHRTPAKMDGGEKIKMELKVIARKIGSEVKKKAPLTADLAVDLIDTIQTNRTVDYRDRALIAFGLASAMRRSELAALQMKHLHFDKQTGFLFVWIAQSKTDQDGSGQKIAIPEGNYIKPLYHIRKWLQISGIRHEEDYLFRPIKHDNIQMKGLSERSINYILKKRIQQAREAGLDIDEFDFGAHSFRSGFVSTAARQKADLIKIMQTTRHKSIQTLKEYIIDHELIEDHAGSSWL